MFSFFKNYSHQNVIKTPSLPKPKTGGISVTPSFPINNMGNLGRALRSKIVVR